MTVKDVGGGEDQGEVPGEPPNAQHTYQVTVLVGSSPWYRGQVLIGFTRSCKTLHQGCGEFFLWV